MHKSGIQGAGSGTAPVLVVGQRVEYQIGQRAKGSAAINVRPAGTAASAPAAGNGPGNETEVAGEPISVAAGGADEG